MSKYSYMNLNQKMIKIRKKIPALIRKRYSEDVDYDFVKLDDINQFLTPALNKYGVDFDILREIPTQQDASGHAQFLMQEGNLWRYEADLEICWTNADHPEERSYSVLHLVGTNDVSDKAKGTAMTYGLKYYLLNKFNIPQNGDDDPDMKGKQTEPPEAKAEEPKSKANPSKKNPGEQKTTKETAFPVEADLEEGLGNAKDRFSGKPDAHGRNGNAVSAGGRNAEKQPSAPVSEKQDRQSQNAGKMTAEKMDGPKKQKETDEGRKTVPEESRREETPVHSSRAITPPTPPVTRPSASEEDEEEMVFFEAEDDEDTTKNAEEEDLADGFRSVTEEDQIPFEEDGQVELDLHLEEERVDSEVEKAKAVICNFGVHRGRPMKELLETPEGRKALKWLAESYAGANQKMKAAAKVLVESDIYMKDAA